MIKAVLFDLDGTLINSLGNYLQAYKEIFKFYGFSLPDTEVVKRCFGRTEETICKELGIPEKAEEFRNMYFGYVRKALPNLRLFPDAIDTLKHIKNRQVVVGLITFAHDWYMKRTSQLFHLAQYAKVMISFDDVKNAKPNPEAVIKACSDLGIDKKEAFVVGDSRSDIFMGRNAGSKTVLYTPEENRKFYNFDELEKEAKPDFVVKHLSEISGLVD